MKQPIKYDHYIVIRNKFILFLSILTKKNLRIKLKTFSKTYFKNIVSLVINNFLDKSYLRFKFYSVYFF